MILTRVYRRLIMKKPGKTSISVTRDDVARLAGVAPSTVSNVINNKGNVSEKLRERIEWAIKELNYTPNMVARSLATKSTKHIGLIIDEITNPHFAQLAKGAHYEANKNGYILSISLGSFGDVNRVVEDFISRQVDGIIYDTYMGKLSPHMGEKIKESGISFVYCNGQTDYGNIFLEIDYYAGMKEAYYYLTELGHSKIAYISGLEPDTSGGNIPPERLEAFRWCCDQFGRNNVDDYIVFGEPPYHTDFKKGYEYANQLLKRNLDITAVIIVNDYMAIGVLRAFKEKGIRIPDDISIVSFDNTVYAESSNPALTSVDSPVFRMGQKAVEYILQQRKTPVEHRQKITETFPTKLVIRESTSPLK